MRCLILHQDLQVVLHAPFYYLFFTIKLSPFFIVGDENLDGIVSEIFKLGLGADELQELTLANQIKSLNEEIYNQLGYKKTDQQNDAKYRKKIDALRISAMNLGLLTENIDINSEEFVAKMKSEIREFNRFRDSRRKGQEIKKLEYEAEEVQEQLRRYKNLRREYNQAKRYAEEVKDSLSPVEYLKQNLNRVILGVETIELLHSLEDAYQSAAQIQLPDNYLPADMEQRVSELKQKLAEINAKQEAFKLQTNRLFDPNWLAQTLKLETELKKIKPVTYKYIGDVELTNKNDLFKDINARYNQLTANNKKCVNDMLSHVQSYYEQQDGMSDNYRNKKVHLCFFFGLQEYIKETHPQRVANFLFIDQPSIPYYGTNRRRGETINEPGDLRLGKRDDESKLKSAFKLIDQFMKQNVNPDKSDNFQIILIEHADPEYWKDFSSFETRYIFTQDKDFGLIPSYVTGE